MNILVLNYEYPPRGGGAASVCRNLTEEMAKTGQRVTVVTMGFRGLPGYEKTGGGVEIYRLACMRKRQFASMPWEQYAYILRSKRFLREHLKRNAYDVCHTHFVIPTGPVAFWAKKQFCLPYLITAHGSDVEDYNRKCWIRAAHVVLRPFWRKIVREAHAAAAPSRYLLHLMERRVRDARLVLVPNGLELEKFSADPERKTDRILLMGRMQASKNIQTVLTAISMIPEETWGDWHADLLGDGPYRQELERLTKELGIADRVSFHGWIGNETREHMEYMGRAAIYISASLFENCPMSVLEAIASGCSPLLSDIEGHRQLLEGNGEAFFFPADDAEKLAAAVAALITEKKTKPLPVPDIRQFGIREVTSRYLALLAEAAKTRNRKH